MDTQWSKTSYQFVSNNINLLGASLGQLLRHIRLTAWKRRDSNPHGTYCIYLCTDILIQQGAFLQPDTAVLPLNYVSMCGAYPLLYCANHQDKHRPTTTMRYPQNQQSAGRLAPHFKSATKAGPLVNKPPGFIEISNGAGNHI